MRKGGEVVATYEDTASGTKFEERPGLLALVRDANELKFDEAVAYNADRWCRSLDVHTMLKRIERETGVRFISATQEFTDDAEGEFLESNIAVVNQYYSRNISKKVKIWCALNARTRASGTEGDVRMATRRSPANSSS